jgi:hypothetical protein
VKSLVTASLAILVVGTVLGGCKGPAVSACPRDPLDDAADYRWLISQAHYFEPLNAWVRHEPLEALASESISGRRR